MSFGYIYRCMVNENYINLSTVSNYCVQDWIGTTLSCSENDWFIAVFKIYGTYKDGNGNRQRIITNKTLPKLYRTIDYTIKDTRRRFGKYMKFIPFIGGDYELGIHPHVHAFIEIPKTNNKWKIKDSLVKNWNIYSKRQFKGTADIKSVLWLNNLNKTQNQNHSSYCQRYEGRTFLKGTEKVLFQCKSCLL